MDSRKRPKLEHNRPDGEMMHSPEIESEAVNPIVLNPLQASEADTSMRQEGRRRRGYSASNLKSEEIEATVLNPLQASEAATTLRQEGRSRFRCPPAMCLTPEEINDIVQDPPKMWEAVASMRQDGRRRPGYCERPARWEETSIGLGRLYPEIAEYTREKMQGIDRHIQRLQDSQDAFDDRMRLHSEELARRKNVLERRKRLLATLKQDASEETGRFDDAKLLHQNVLERGKDFLAASRQQPRPYDPPADMHHFLATYRKGRNEPDESGHIDEDSYMLDAMDDSAPAPSPDEEMEDQDRIELLSANRRESQSTNMVDYAGSMYAVQQVPSNPTEGLPGLVAARGTDGSRPDINEQQTPGSLFDPITTRSGRDFTESKPSARRQRAEPVFRSKNVPLTKQPVPPFQVRDASNQAWVPSSAVSFAAAQLFANEAGTMATYKSHWQHFARLVQRPDRFTVSYCVQCAVIPRKPNACSFQRDNECCDQCLKAGRPCAKIIEIDGTMYLGWLPVQDAASSGAGWGEKSFWVRE